MEDDPAILTMTRSILDLHGYRTVPARTPEEALAQDIPSIELVLTDVVMPGMNGRELVTELRKRNPSIRHLFISGHCPDIMEKWGALGDASVFLQKPFSIKELACKVRHALDGVAAEGC